MPSTPLGLPLAGDRSILRNGPASYRHAKPRADQGGRVLVYADRARQPLDLELESGPHPEDLPDALIAV